MQQGTLCHLIWKTRFGKIYGLTARETMEWINSSKMEF